MERHKHPPTFLEAEGEDPCAVLPIAVRAITARLSRAFALLTERLTPHRWPRWPLVHNPMACLLNK